MMLLSMLARVKCSCRLSLEALPCVGERTSPEQLVIFSLLFSSSSLCWFNLARLEKSLQLPAHVMATFVKRETIAN